MLDWELEDSTLKHKTSSVIWSDLLTLWPAVSSQKKSQGLNGIVFEIPSDSMSSLPPAGMHLDLSAHWLPAEFLMFVLSYSSSPSALSHLFAPTVLAPSVVFRCPDSARMRFNPGSFSYMR